MMKLWLGFLMCMSSALSAQTSVSGGKQSLDPQKTDLPSLKVDFSSPNTDSPLNLPSAAVNGPPVCNTDGLAFFQFLTPPPYYNKKHVYSVSADGKVVNYPVDQITGLTNSWVIFSDPGLTNAVILFHAKKVGAAAASPDLYYMALFDYDGKLRDYTDLDLGFEPIQALQLSDDRFLVSGSDVARARLRFVVIDSAGTVIRELSPLIFLPGDADLREMLGSINSVNGAGINPSDLPVPQRLSLTISLFRPVHSDRALLILEPGSVPRVIEISRAGESRVVKLTLPPNQIANSLLTTKGRWFLRTAVQGSNTQWNLLEIDPTSGQTLRWIDTSGVPASSIACATGSGFLAMRWLDHKPYLLDGTFK